MFSSIAKALSGRPASPPGYDKAPTLDSDSDWTSSPPDSPPSSVSPGSLPSARRFMTSMVRKPIAVSPKTVDNSESEVSGLADGIMRKSGVPQSYRAALRPVLSKKIIEGRSEKIRNTDAQLFNILAGHTCVKDWIAKGFSEFEKQMEPLKEHPELGEMKRTIFLDNIATILGIGFNLVQEPNPKKPFFERDAEGKIVGILNAVPGQANFRFKECDAAIRSGETLGGRRQRKTRKSRGGKAARKSRRRKLH
jgi:hypothetical protein